MTKVHILMGVYNGEAYLPAQLDSIAAQDHVDWRLTCSDDGSSDESRAVIAEFTRSVSQQVVIRDGPRKGFSENFLSMLRELPDDTGHVAFADQDDIWLPGKLTRALERLPSDRPALYGAATLVWTPATGAIRPTPPVRRPPCFANALIENVATGNTMVLNPPAARFLRDASQRIGAVYSHDWWTYALMTGAGHAVIYDDNPCMRYRQHAANEIGAGETFLKRQRRNWSVGRGLYRRKVGQNVDALSAISDLLTSENRAMLATFAEARDRSGPLARVVGLWRSGVFRQSRRDMVGFLGAGLSGLV